jgi:hypothetical protein
VKQVSIPKTISQTTELRGFYNDRGHVASDDWFLLVSLVTVAHYKLLLVTTLTQNNGRKDGDMHIYSAQSGMDTLFPGIVIEVGRSDELSKARRDATLWVSYSDYNVLSFRKYILILPGESWHFVQGRH